jgi:ketosteroid isomerase-like protein
MSDADRDLLAANAAFYDAFARKDPQAMEELWAREAPVACLHPGWEPLLGREAVLRSWRGILLGGNAPPIRCESPVAYVLGESAYVICNERVPGGVLAATNLFVRERGKWRMAHHHASPLPRASAPSEPPPGLPN